MTDGKDICGWTKGLLEDGSVCVCVYRQNERERRGVRGMGGGGKEEERGVGKGYKKYNLN